MYRIGIDLGGTKMAVGVVDESYNIIVKRSLPTVADRPADKIVDDIAKLCGEVCSVSGLAPRDIEGIGLATPGMVDSASGIVLYANNLPFRALPAAKMIADRTGVTRVKVANDANAAALGEAVAGAAKGTSHSVMVTLGTGVGGGIIIDGKIFAGTSGAGAELGHMVIEKGGARCTCGRCGCWEAYSSATALIRMTKEAIQKAKQEGRHTLLENYDVISGRSACDAMREGDEVATEVYNKYISYLATGLTNVINIFEPEVISLGGGISNEGQSLIDDLLPLVRQEQYGADIMNTTELRIAKLKNDAGIIGASALLI